MSNDSEIIARESDSKMLFTEKQLKEFSKSYMELALDALEKGDLAAAKHWCTRNKETEGAIHHAYLAIVADIWSFAYDVWGEQFAVNAIKRSTRDAFEVFADVWRSETKSGEVRDHVQFIVEHFWRLRFGEYSILEDQEKFTFTHDCCGSGGRLMNAGAYEGPRGFRRLKKAGPHTWGETDVPIYCAQCSWFHEILPVEFEGAGSQWWVHASPFPRKVGDACIHHVYKDPANIPSAFYERVGMESPEWSRSVSDTGAIFSEAELQELSKGYTDLAVEALDRNDVEVAIRWCRKFEETKFRVHDLGAVLTTATMSYILEHCGEDAVHRVWREFFNNETANQFSQWMEEILTTGEPGRRLELLVDLWRSHTSPPTVEEDEEKFILTLGPCGSGGRLLDKGYYDTPMGFGRIKNATQSGTWNKENVPIYCSHCSWVNEIRPVLTMGQGKQLFVHADQPFPKAPGQSCVHYVYKNPQDIPSRYYERHGLKKDE